jgi:putative ABC transport system permease protein
MLSIQELIAATGIGLVYGIMAIGIYLTFRTINFADLTCDGSFAFGAAVSSVMIKSCHDPWVSIFFAFLAGGLAGFCTGALNIWLKIEDLLSGIIVAFMIYSINLRIMGSSPNITLANEATIFVSGGAMWKIGLVVSLLTVTMAYLLNTNFGLALRSIGKNRIFASACGINTNLMIMVGLVVSNAMISGCGALFSQYQGFFDVSQGTGCLVVGLASVTIGEKLLTFKNVGWKVAACVVGSVAYRIFIAFAINGDIFGLTTQDLNLITGLMIIATMGRKKCCK